MRRIAVYEVVYNVWRVLKVVIPLMAIAISLFCLSRMPHNAELLMEFTE